MEVDVERAENESFADLYRAAAPELGIELLELGEVACGAVRGFSSRIFNRVMGLTSKERPWPAVGGHAPAGHVPVSDTGTWPF